MKVKIFNYKPLEKPYRTMRGTVSLELPEIGVCLPGCTVHSSNGSHYWLHLPSKLKADNSGAAQWVRTFVFCDLEEDTDFRRSVDKAFDEFWREQADMAENN